MARNTSFKFYSNREYLEMLPVISGNKLKELAEAAHNEQLKKEVENGFTSSFVSSTLRAIAPSSVSSEVAVTTIVALPDITEVPA